MFNFRRRPASFSTSYYSPRQKKKRRSSVWWLAAIPVGLIGLEILLRIGTSLSGHQAELDSYVGEPSIVTAYRLKPLNQSGQPIQGVPSQGRLVAQQSALTGYRLVGNQQNPFVKINAQGFRADQPIDSNKPQNEIRILLLGGSTAFGQLSSSNHSTIAYQLEKRLNQQVQDQKTNSKQFRPDVLPYYADELEKALKLPPKIRESQYRVINAAVPGYASGNILSQLASHLLTYKPDVIILVDGYTDLLLPSSQEATTLVDTDSLLANATGHFFSSLSQGIQDGFGSLYLVRGIEKWLIQPQPSIESLVDPLDASHQPLADRFAPTPEEQTRRIDRYTRNLEQIAHLASASNAMLLVGLQPELSHRHNPSAREKQVLDQLGTRYTQHVQDSYQQLAGSIAQAKKAVPGLTTIDLQTAFDGVAGDAFQDTVNLTDRANQALADRLYDVIAPKLQVQPKPFGG